MVGGGTGDLAGTETSVEYLDLETRTEWIKLGPLSTPRCCWPHVVSLGSQLSVISGEMKPSNSIEMFNNKVT